jgi:hypothetical protein
VCYSGEKSPGKRWNWKGLKGQMSRLWSHRVEERKKCVRPLRPS